MEDEQTCIDIIIDRFNAVFAIDIEDADPLNTIVTPQFLEPASDKRLLILAVNSARRTDLFYIEVGLFEMPVSEYLSLVTFIHAFIEKNPTIKKEIESVRDIGGQSYAGSAFLVRLVTEVSASSTLMDPELFDGTPVRKKTCTGLFKAIPDARVLGIVFDIDRSLGSFLYNGTTILLNISDLTSRETLPDTE